MRALLLTLLRSMVRRPACWVAVAALALLGPGLEGLGRSGALAQRDRASGAWVEDVAWLSAVTGIAAATWWLGRGPGLRWILGGWDRWWKELGVLAVTGAVLLALGSWPAYLGAGAERVEGDLRMVLHLAALALLCSRWAGDGAWGWRLFLALALLLPTVAGLLPDGAGPSLSALADPRHSGNAGWWIVGAVAAWSLAASLQGTENRHPSPTG